MALTIEKLKALIRLANNNPNEHEANLAARKVCQSLDNGQFAIIQGVSKDKFEDAAAKTWNDVKRSTEPFWKPSPPPPSKQPDPTNPGYTWHVSDDIYEFFNNFRNHADPFGPRPSEKQKKYWTDSVPHVDAPEPREESEKKSPKYRHNPFTGEKEARRQELRVCSKCGFETMTYRLNEVPWICNPCHWKDA